MQAELSLQWLQQQQLVRPLDVALATTLHRCDAARNKHTPMLLQCAAALASYALTQGDVALALAHPPRYWDEEQAKQWPTLLQWQQALADSDWVQRLDGQPACVDAVGAVPLVLENNLLYLRRYRQYEAQLVSDIARLLHADCTAPGAAENPMPQPVRALFDALFPSDGDASQANAAKCALQQRFCILSGGPGAGKTTTIVRILLLLLQAHAAQHSAPLRIALAAPTGRAADRMAASVRAARWRLADIAPEPLLQALPDSAQTLHRLLGYRHQRVDFHHNADNPLPWDVLVVDEASMIDLPMMSKLLRACPPQMRLILVGDAAQLPSVEAGAVLAALLKAAETTNRLPHAQLTGRWRQEKTLTLAPLSDAMLGSNGAQALALLRAQTLQGVRFFENGEDILQAPLREEFLQPWRALLQVNDPVQALEMIDAQRVLTALREGAQGADMLNARIEDALLGKKHADYFHGRLLMVTENSHRHGLYNGDVGVCLKNSDGVMEVWFHGHEQHQPRAFLPGNLPAHTSTWASTVHKAQGSEFARVWLVLPTQQVRLLNRALVYTGITRARQSLCIVAPATVLQSALRRHDQRMDGLCWRLLAASPEAATGAAAQVNMNKI